MLQRGPLRLFYCVYQRPKKRPPPPVEVSSPPVKKSKPAPVPVLEYSDITKDASLLKQHCDVKDETKQGSEKEKKVEDDTKEEKSEEGKVQSTPLQSETTPSKSAETKEKALNKERPEIPKEVKAPTDNKGESKTEPEPKKQQEPIKKQSEPSRKQSEPSKKPEVIPVVVSQPAAASQKHQPTDSKSHSGSKTQSTASKPSHGSHHHERSRKSSTSGSNGKSNNNNKSPTSNYKSHTSPKSDSPRVGDDSNVKKPPLKLTLSVPQAPGIARVIKETVTRAHNNEGKIGKDGVIDYSTDSGRNKSNTVTAAPGTKPNKASTQRPAPSPIKVPMDGPKPKLDDNFNHNTLLPPSPTQEGRPRVIKENNHTHAHTPPVSMAQTQSKEQGKKKETTSPQGEQDAPLDLHTRPKVVEVS